MNATSRRKKMAKLGLPDCKWMKSPELDAFITSTIPKEVIKNDNVAQKTQRLWLEAASLLAAIVDKTDGDKISDAEVIQGIRNALLLLGNACQQHSLQRRKAILQHLNPQIKSLVQDADFADAPPYLFRANFGELAKERLEAAALIQKAQVKHQNFQKRHPQSLIRGGSRTFNRGSSRGRGFHAGGWNSRNNTSNNNNRGRPIETINHVCMPNLNLQKSMSCIPALSLPQGPVQHLQVFMSRLEQIDSHKESTASSDKLEYTDRGQMGSANSTRVYDRFHPDTSSVPSIPSKNNITRQSCSGDTGSARANPERGNNRDYCLLRQLCLPDIPGREKGRGATPSSYLQLST